MGTCFFVACKSVKQRFPIRGSELDRFRFGKRRYYELFFLHKRSPFCLDVACGAKPFPEADVLCDLNVNPVPDRRMRCLVTENKPFVLCDCCYLPFKDKAFDFVTSYYLIEHIDDPWGLFRELKRVSRHGYIQCPSWFNELLYGEAVHKWLVFKRGGRLYVKPRGKRMLGFGFVFHKLYRSVAWQVVHAFLDEAFNLFSVRYSF